MAGKDLAGVERGKRTCGRNLAPRKPAKEWGMRALRRLLQCERGANAIEYALVATLISIAAIGAFNGLGNKIDSMYNNVGNAM
jgi:pilus assembly protein Flp/PilA